MVLGFLWVAHGKEDIRKFQYVLMMGFLCWKGQCPADAWLPVSVSVVSIRAGKTIPHIEISMTQGGQNGSRPTFPLGALGLSGELQRERI